MRPRAQFHVFNFKTQETEVYFVEQTANLALPQAIYGAPGKNGVKGAWRAKVFAASKEDHDALVEVLQADGIVFRPGEPFHLGISRYWWCPSR